MFHKVPAWKLFLVVVLAIKCDAFVLQPQFNVAQLNGRSVYLWGSTTDTDQDFWAKQKELVSEMQEKSNRSLQQELKEKFAKRRLGLVSDTAYFGFFIFCGMCREKVHISMSLSVTYLLLLCVPALWSISDNPFTALSYSFGATMGLAYAFGLGACFSPRILMFILFHLPNFQSIHRQICGDNRRLSWRCWSGQRGWGRRSPICFSDHFVYSCWKVSWPRSWAYS